MRRKDNLTDVVEQLPQSATTSDPKTPKDQVVVGVNGELVTLGKKPAKTKYIQIHGKSFELSKVEKMIQEVVKEQMKELPQMILDELERKLKEEGFIK